MVKSRDFFFKFLEWSLLSNNSDNKKAGLLLIRFEVFAHCKAFSIQPHPDHKIPWYKKMLRRLRMQTIQLKILWSDIKFIYLYLFCCFSIYLLKLASSAGNELQYLVVHNKVLFWKKRVMGIAFYRFKKIKSFFADDHRNKNS